MTDTVLVNLHCHTIFSDGELTPEALAANLVAAGVRYAALTDHDTLEGLPRFQDALRKRGIASLPGLELTARFHGREVHLLAYGFDPHHPELLATLLSLRQTRGPEVHSIAESMRKVGSRPPGADHTLALSAAPQGWLDVGEAIALIHRAGGRAFWAHPLVFEADEARLDALASELAALGLDGIEAIYAPFTPEDQARLQVLAKRHGLSVCAGTDVHGANGPGNGAYAINMPRAAWTDFRNLVLANDTFATAPSNTGASGSGNGAEEAPPARRDPRFRRRSNAVRILLPTVSAIALLLAAFWGILLPSVERTLLERKQEMIRELTNSAYSILESYYRDEQDGWLTREQAQAQAIAPIQALRYGPEGKDYFWIQDLHPRMIMHPYRPDLNGQDLSGFTDPAGRRIFVEFAALVQRNGEGTVDYVWQWNDDPDRLEPKESYVKGFEPWGWLIGTGLYIDDVRAEIARIERNLILAAVAASGAIVVLLLFVLQQSLAIERERQEVVDNLRESTARYHTLLEATTEGTLLVLDERCRYANPTLLNMLGYTAPQLEFLELTDVLPPAPENAAMWQHLRSPNGEQEAWGEALEGCLARRDGALLECVISVNPIIFAGQHGVIMLARDVTIRPNTLGEDGLVSVAQTAPLGIFRARAARRAVFTEMNQAARAFLPPTADLENRQPALADLFREPAEYDQFMQDLLAAGEVRSHLLHLQERDGRAVVVSLSARLVRDERDQPTYVEGLLEDVTADYQEDARREALIDRLQASLLFLHEPLANLGREAVVCRLDATIEQAARQMTARQATAALVASESGAVIGIVTDHDLRARALAENIPPHTPVHAIMSSPLTRISEQARMYEALMRMEERGVRHLAVEDGNGQIVGVVDSKSLVQFPRYGPMVLTREIACAHTPAEVAQHCQRTALLARSLLDSSARPQHVTHMLASICDSATQRLIELALDELGPPPVPFAFIAMGSQGREEQTLLTDQDNGIIFAPVTEGDSREVANYFLRLGRRVCEGLDQAGYALCRGKVMASNPRWCRSLPAWITGFGEWIGKSEPQEIVDFSIFFDFRTVYGEAQLTHELRRTIHSTLSSHPGFFHLFAQNALQFKPPFRLLGNIYLSAGATEHAGEINLKDAMMPVVSFARLYALRHQVNQTHTLERIEALVERSIILPASRDEIAAAYDFLMALRLQTQLAAIGAGRPPQNVIHPGRLGHIQRELLKQAFAQIAAVQKKVGYDFLGGA